MKPKGDFSVKRHTPKFFLRNPSDVPKKLKKFCPQEDSPPTPMQTAAKKIRALVFDILYGSGAWIKSQMFLLHYKIPKRCPSATACLSENTGGNDAPYRECNSDAESECYSIVTVDNSGSCKRELEIQISGYAEQDDSDVLVISAEDDNLFDFLEE